jgi:hypothetical protein
MTAAFGRQLMGLEGMHYYVPQFRRELNGLGALRFNRAVARGMYALPFYEPPPRQRLGNLGAQVDTTTLLLGIGALALGMFLFGGKVGPKLRKRRAARLRRRHVALGRRIAELEA